MEINKTVEDYLEAMLMIKESKGQVRSIDVADLLGVTKPSVSYMTKRLREGGYITMDETGLITLTPTGASIASRIYNRHKTLTRVFIELGVDEETAAKDACLVEHDLSHETYQALCDFLLEKLDPQEPSKVDDSADPKDSTKEGETEEDI